MRLAVWCVPEGRVVGYLNDEHPHLLRVRYMVEPKLSIKVGPGMMSAMSPTFDVIIMERMRTHSGTIYFSSDATLWQLRRVRGFKEVS